MRCASGTWDHDANSATPCTSWSSCPAGSVQLAAGTATSDTVCSSCSDGLKNASETDVDCGGTCVAKCGMGKTCSAGADCTSGQCISGVCSALWDPGVLGPAIWLDASDASMVTVVGGLVSEWRDKSGNGRHATQATAASRPTYVASGLGSKATMRFPDSGKRLGFASAYGTVGKSYAMVLMREASGNITPLINGANAYSYLHYGSSWYDGNAGISSPMNSSSWYVNISASGTRTSNGAVVGSGQDAASQFLTINSSFSGVAWNAAELVVVGSTLAESDRQKLEGYLAWKWGLQSSLPAAHPYKNAAP